MLVTPGPQGGEKRQHLLLQDRLHECECHRGVEENAEESQCLSEWGETGFTLSSLHSPCLPSFL